MRMVLSSLILAASFLLPSTARAAELCWADGGLQFCSVYSMQWVSSNSFRLHLGASGTMQNIRITDVGFFGFGGRITLAGASATNVESGFAGNYITGALPINDAAGNSTPGFADGAGTNLFASSGLTATGGAKSDPQHAGIISTGSAFSSGYFRADGSTSYVSLLFTTSDAITRQALKSAGFGYFAQGTNQNGTAVSLRCFNAPNTSAYDCGGPGITSTVPEPSTYVLTGAGLLGILGVARRRRR
jgi:hypothetical protein